MQLWNYVKAGDVLDVKVPSSAGTPRSFDKGRYHSACINDTSYPVSAHAATDYGPGFILLEGGCAHLDGACWVLRYPLKLRLTLIKRAVCSFINKLIKRG